MTRPLIIYTLRPQGPIAQQFAQFLRAADHVVQLRPLSALPPPIGWEERQRKKLILEKEELRQAIGGLEIGIALAAAAPHRIPDGAMWAEQKHRCERRLRVVAWKLQQLGQEGGVKIG